MENVAAEGLYLDRLPWENVYEGRPKPVGDFESAQHDNVFLLPGATEAHISLNVQEPPSYRADYEWPFFQMNLARYAYLDLHPLCYWLPDQTQLFVAVASKQVAMLEDKTVLLKILGSAGGAEGTPVAVGAPYDSGEVLRRDEHSETSSSAAPTYVESREPRPSPTNYRARLALLPRFIREVFAHPFSDFTLVKRGDKVFVAEEGADFSGQDLSGVDLHGANLKGATLRETNLSDAILRRADLRRADLRGAVLDNADLRDADLRGVRVDEQTLSQAITDGALLNGGHPTK